MFTGIVQTVGEVLEASPSRLAIASDLSGLVLGESIAVGGVCLTVAEHDGGTFFADVTEETLSRTSLGDLAPGRRVNLERAMSASDRFGGHIVQGHVDGVGRVLRSEELPASVETWFELPARLERYLVEKGSVTVEGVSLTVASLNEGEFSVSLVSHTLASTTLGSVQPGDRVNLEVDVLAKYVERLLDAHIRR